AHTSTAEIAEAAGVAEGSIFYHFGSKSKLLDSLGAVYAHEKVAAMARGETDLSKLEPGIMIERAFAYCEAHGMGEAQVGLDQDNPELQPFIEVNREIVVGFISKVMAASMPPESPAYADIEIAASLAYAAVTDALCHVFARPDPLDRDAVLRETIRFVRAACGYDAGTKAIQHEKPDG
ncbi:MAG: TetR/AcrR family transcriptional regulator, partial [Pseudomonadota bacterium]